MIKDILVRLDGTAGDFARLDAVSWIAATFESHITGLLFNVLPAAISDVVQDAGSSGPEKRLHDARKAGEAVEATVLQRLERLQQPTFLRRFDVEGERDIADNASLLARAADTFVALRPNGQPNEPRGLIEELLYGAGRHLFLVPEDRKTMAPLDHIVVAWNGSRESARALSESLPYLQRARKVWLLVVENERPANTDALRGDDAVQHLRHHGINAVKYRAVGEDDEIADIVIEECRRLGADLLVMGSYGHSRLHELLPGSTTSRLLHHSPVPLVIAH